MNLMEEKLREALDKFPHFNRRTTPDPERVPLATNEEVNQSIRDTELLYRPILNTSIGK